MQSRGSSSQPSPTVLTGGSGRARGDQITSIHHQGQMGGETTPIRGGRGRGEGGTIRRATPHEEPDTSSAGRGSSRGRLRGRPSLSASRSFQSGNIDDEAFISQFVVQNEEVGSR